MARDELTPDPNYPGLLVCQDDLDQFDPYRLPAREADRLQFDGPRPDVSLAVNQPTPVYANQISNIGNVGAANPWSANTPYQKGATVTPQNVNASTTTLPQPWFLALTTGTSAASAPAWPQNAGVTVQDGGVLWLSLGIYPV